MTKGKPWPDSQSEYVVPDDMLRMREMVPTLSTRSHHIARNALFHLRGVAERYYEAAGFRS